MLRRSLLALLCACFFVPHAGATWSIVVVNRRTGEVAVGAATCIAQINLTRGLPAIVNGVGAGVIQSAGSSFDLPPMVEGMRAGLSPEELLEIVLSVEPNVPQLQTGIVTMEGSPVTFSGFGVGPAKLGVVGEVGDLAYAIQGNVLAGQAVVLQAERALLDAEGDLGQKLLAGMIAARQYGGDGRCSCSLENFGKDADDCGSPPESFAKSAHVGFMLLARQGDLEAPCVQANGIDCANRGYHMRLIIRGSNAQIQDPDPVDQLVGRYANWRAERLGRPDGVLSRVSKPVPMPADGRTRQVITVQLVDIDGRALTHGRPRLEIVAQNDDHTLTRIEEIENHQDGTYSITIRSADRPSTDTFVIRARDDLLDMALYPFLEIESSATQTLYVGNSGISAGQGAAVSMVLSVPDMARADYLILGSLAAVDTGLRQATGLLPLSNDPILAFTVAAAGHEKYLPGTVGRLDEHGRAEASFRPPPGVLIDLIGRRLEWAAIVAGKNVRITNVAGLEIHP